MRSESPHTATRSGAFLNNPAYSDEENLSDTESVVAYTRKDVPAHNSHSADIHNQEKVCNILYVLKNINYRFPVKTRNCNFHRYAQSL